MTWQAVADPSAEIAPCGKSCGQRYLAKEKKTQMKSWQGTEKMTRGVDEDVQSECDTWHLPQVRAN